MYYSSELSSIEEFKFEICVYSNSFREDFHALRYVKKLTECSKN